MIKVDQVYKEYRGGTETFFALKGVSLEVNEGEFVSLLGRSGSGKSTLMHLIGGLDRPSRGKITVGSQDLSLLSDTQLADFRNKKVGFIFQSFNLIPHLSVFDNVHLPIIYAKVKPTNTRDQIENLLASVGLSSKINNRPNQLSGGEQQRVAIARALVNDPQILLADEPTGNLDTATGNEILKILLNLRQIGKTIVLVTHDEKLASNADRTISIQDGQFVNTSGVVFRKN